LAFNHVLSGPFKAVLYSYFISILRSLSVNILDVADAFFC
jgi:hypothetical protein